MKRFLSLMLAAVMLVCASVGTCMSAYAGNIFGIDISEHNGVVDFVDVKNANKEFVMIRLGYIKGGKWMTDEKFWTNVENAHKTKMDFGVYFYSYAWDTNEAKAEANFVIDTLSKLIDKGYGEYFTLPVAYDLEDKIISDHFRSAKDKGKAQITNNMVTFCDAVKNAGYVPMVYANLNWFTNYINLNTAVSKNYKLWYAYWQNGAPDFSKQITIGDTGVKADMWQYIDGESEDDNFDKNIAYNSDDLVKPLPALTKTSASLSLTSTYYTGSVKTPAVTVKNGFGKDLVKGTDYDVTYDSGRINVGRYAVKITYKGIYKGTQTLYFNIIPKGVSGITSAVSKPEGFAVQWAKQTTQTTGYEVQYSTNSNMSGAKTIVMPKPDYYAKTITGLGANKTYYVRVRTYKVTKFNGADYKIYSPYCAVKSVKTSAYRSATASLNVTATYYNGKVKTPSVTVKDKSSGKVLKNGTDYTVSYASGRKNVGRYAVKVTYKGNYKGSQTLYFNIIPKGVSKISKVTPKSKGFAVQWTKQTTQTTGYQIQYSTNKNMSGAKTITMPKNTYYAKNITGLKGNTRYYVRIRTYKVTKFNGKNYNIYSPWCAAKYVTTKR